MKKLLSSINFYALLCALILSISVHAQKPKLTVIIVVDQCAYHYLPTLKPYFKYGFKELLDNGIVYTNAYYPHALPATATGHAALNTGTYAKNHGVISNKWLDATGKCINSDDDTPTTAAVFAPDGLYDYGKSAHTIMVDGLSDQIMLQCNPENPTDVFAISLKSRAAIGMAGKLGKAIWLDPQTRFFTSSKAYFKAIPDWINNFNNQAHLNTLKTITWQTKYPRKSPAYQCVNTQSYRYAASTPVAGKTISAALNNNQYEDPVQQNPLGNKICLDLAGECINTHLSRHDNRSMVLWISLSSLDIVGHAFGPNCLETIDMIYHLDKQIHTFMHRITNKFGKQNVLFVLTSDHGIEPIPEIIAQKGIPARRLFLGKWIPEINDLISRTLSLDRPLIRGQFQAPYLSFDETLFNQLDKKQQDTAIALIKTYLMQKPGIKKIWHHKELESAYFNENDVENFFKQQLYPGRSGSIIIQTDPYNQLTTFTKGTDHCTPYEPNTHVPLIMYQPGTYEHTIIDEKVWTLQLANTLAHILQVPKPSASTFNPLPGIQ